MRFGHIVLFLFITIATSKATIVAVVDRSSVVGSGLTTEQLSVLAQAARGELANGLRGLGVTILSEETTYTLLREQSVDISSCDSDCELEIARNLQTDYLLTLNVVSFGAWWTVQGNLIQTASGKLLEGQTRECSSQIILRQTTQDVFGVLGKAVRAEIGEDPFLDAQIEDSVTFQMTGQRNKSRTERSSVNKSFIGGYRNRIGIEIGYNQEFFLPWESYWFPVERPWSWGGALRIPNLPAGTFDVVVDWWRASSGNDDSYSLVKGAIDATPFHWWIFHPYASLGYQGLWEKVPQQEKAILDRCWLGGVGMELRFNRALSVSAGLEALQARNPKLPFFSVDRYWRGEFFLSHKSFGVVLGAMMDAENLARPVHTIRIRYGQ